MQIVRLRNKKFWGYVDAVYINFNTLNMKNMVSFALSLQKQDGAALSSASGTWDL